VRLPLAGFIRQVQHVDILLASVTFHDHPLLLACLDGEEHSFLFVVVAEIFNQFLPSCEFHLLFCYVARTVYKGVG